MQLTGEDLADRLVQRQPARQYGSFLVRWNEITFGFRDGFRIAGEEDAQALGAEAGRGS